MNWHWIHGFLVITFALHLTAFVVVYWRTQKRRYLFLCGTFVALTLLFTVKFSGLDPLWAVVLLRTLAVGFTVSYLWNRWFERRSQRGESMEVSG